jgi:hypothetical protein
MTTKSKADKIRSIEAAPETPAVEASAEAPAAIVWQPVAAESVAAEPAADVADIVSAPLAVIEEAVEKVSESFSASFKLDSSGLTQ